MKLHDFIILVDTKAKMSLKAEASRLYLSFLWWIIEPMLFVLAFYFVFGMLLKVHQEDFLIFLMCAKIPYMWFSKAVTSAAGSIVGNRGIISQLDVPKILFPYSAIQVTLYKETPVFILLAALCAGYGYHPQVEWFWLIPLIVALYLLIASLSLLFALLVCYADDVRMLISMLMLCLMFLSGIFFDISTIDPPLRDYLLIFNPLAFLCDAFRKIFMNKGMYDLQHLVWLMLFCIVSISVLHVVYRQMSRAIAAKVVNA